MAIVDPPPWRWPPTHYYYEGPPKAELSPADRALLERIAEALERIASAAEPVNVVVSPDLRVVIDQEVDE